MRIGIDARFYGPGGKGLGRYVSELIAGLERLDDGNEYVVFLRRDNYDQYEPKSPNFTKALAEYPWYGWREQLLYPLFLRKFSLDLMHFTHFNVPLLYRRPFVLTVHDLILLQHPSVRATTLGPLLYRLKFLAYRWVIASALRRARGIATVSQTTREEVERRFPFVKEKQILVTRLACSGNVLPDSGTPRQGDETERAPDIGGPFILYVGSAYPHKNLERLLEAFRTFREERPEWRLVLVGGSDYFYERLRHEAAERGLDAGVVFFGRTSDQRLGDLYRQAEFYVFPSLCEGFGLPPLEAMCNGLAVASSDRSCMPEILGDAAHYFNPEDPQDIARALGDMADDRELREELIERGKKRASRYDWDSTARATKALYDTFG